MTSGINIYSQLLLAMISTIIVDINNNGIVDINNCE